MKLLLIALAGLAVIAEAKYLDLFEDELFRDPQDIVVPSCQFNCNNAANSNNKCVNGQCQCAQGFGGQYCTCEELCRTPFGTCNNDEAGTCTCLTGWKGRNCNCPATCPDTNNWRCKTGDTIQERGCICRVDNQPWFSGKKCCPTLCQGDGLSCPKDDGVCECSHTNTKIPYGSSADKYKCCPKFCDNNFCECRNDGCYNRRTGQKATSADDCKAPVEGSCKTHGSWEECSIVHWQGKCVCDPSGQNCACKCWYGWAGGKGAYATQGWEKDSNNKALYSQHCKNRCDWTHDYQPGYCSDCEEVDCPECVPAGSKKCKGTA